MAVETGQVEVRALEVVEERLILLAWGLENEERDGERKKDIYFIMIAVWDNFGGSRWFE